MAIMILRRLVLPMASMTLVSLMAIIPSSAAAEQQSQRWTEKKAWQWYGRIGPIRGVNYVPSTAVNMLEWWQKETFDPATIDRELKWAHESGYNSVRCNLSFEVWEADSAGMEKRLDQFLAIAARNKILVMLCLFDDVNFARAVPKVGKQPAPMPGVHNSRWVPSPAAAKVTDPAARPMLEKYVKAIVGKFRKDKRVLIWDLYNEPGNGGLGEKSKPLVELTFKWAREMKPVQPLTTGPWTRHFQGMSLTMVALSDIVSFHYYGGAEVEAIIQRFKEHGRPLLSTETIRRQPGKGYAAMLPVYAKHQVGWYNWGFVAGKQQTYLPWEKQGQTIWDHWHWDMLWPDGKPYDPKEIELIKNFTFNNFAQ